MAKILVIDDDPTIRLILKRTLERSGYDVILTTNGEDGIKEAKDLYPDLIICDWMMPKMDGLQVCQAIKTNSELSRTYFILLTMRGKVDDLVTALDTGADDYLSKPLDMNELQARVRAGLRSRRLTEELHSANQQLIARNELLESLSLTDGLTGLLNRRAMDQALPHILQQVGDRDVNTRYRYLCVLMMDVDYFKKINDTYGHPVGDVVLQAISGRLKSHVRPSSLLYRYGGEELVCVTPGLNLPNCIAYAESLRTAICDYPIKVSENVLISASISIGGAIASTENLVDSQDLLQQADQALYQAKQGGRNCLRISTNSYQIK